MKKFASLLLSLMMVVSMVVVGVISASAADESVEATFSTTDSSSTGSSTVNIYKNLTASTVSSGNGLAGATFTIYKVMSYSATADNVNAYNFLSPFATAAEDSTTYPNLAAMKKDLTLYTDSNNDEYYVTYGDVDTFEAAISELQKIIAANSGIERYSATTVDKTGHASFTNLTNGVYLVVETEVPDGYTASDRPFLVSISADGQTVNAYPKNSTANVDKNIITTTTKDRNDVETPVKEDSVSVGDTVTYEVRADIPLYNSVTLSELTDTEKEKLTLTVTDTFSDGLTLNIGSDNTINADDFEIYVVDKDDSISGATALTDTGATFVQDGQTFTITFPSSFLLKQTDDAYDYLGKQLVLRYSATVNKNAVTGSTGNTNKVDVKYYNDPTSTTNDPASHTPEEYPKVYVYQLDITKTLDGETYKTIGNSKVTFGLTKVADCGIQELSIANLSVKDSYGAKSYQSTDLDPPETIYATGSEGIYTVCAEGTDGATSTFELSSDGKLTIKGLSDGIYELSELETVTGYTALSAPIQIVVKEDWNDELTEISSQKAVAYYLNGDGDEVYLDENADGIMEITVNNPKSQFDLPTTGGIGILIFTLGAAVVLAGAVIIFMFARKKKTEQ